MTESTWSETPAALARLKGLDPELMVVGASVHKYELAEPATTAAVEAWEAKHGVSLPEAYRSFLLTVGDGGPGPGEGMLPLASEWDRGDPGVPFTRGKLDGLLPLCRYDSSSWDMLLVNGPQPGTVWNLSGGHLDDWYDPDSGGLMTFKPWFTGWVQQITAALAD